MQKEAVTSIFESLSSPKRLDVFRLLVKQGPRGMVAGDIATALEVRPSSLSFHLKGMTHASLLTVEQEGRYQRYRANLALMVEMIGYLTEACCTESLGEGVELPRKTNCTPSALAVSFAADHAVSEAPFNGIKYQSVEIGRA